jgi:hexulose-6-phosphate isomerase
MPSTSERTDDYLRQYAEGGVYTMQGRLSAPEDGRFQSFPRAHWRDEIVAATGVPLRGIEWIYDAYGEGANPLETAEGRATLRNELARAGIRVVSICADWFMDRPLVRIDRATLEQRVARLDWLLSIAPEMAIGRVVLPFVDASRMQGATDVEQVLEALHAVLPRARQSQVELHLETDLGPAEFRAFLAEIPDPMVRVNYDSGNSAALGFRPAEEFAAYGERIGSFHIKDRVPGGSTVPLGQGGTDFAALRAGLIDIGYRGDFVLQVARGEVGDEVAWLRRVAHSACHWLRGQGLDH